MRDSHSLFAWISGRLSGVASNCTRDQSAGLQIIHSIEAALERAAQESVCLANRNKGVKNLEWRPQSHSQWVGGITLTCSKLLTEAWLNTLSVNELKPGLEDASLARIETITGFNGSLKEGSQRRDLP